MAPKILTVDDSKTVQMIIRKTFRPFACEIFDAANGVEGLAAAARIMPNLILLDITMPVMDGVEMLTRLRSDPALKNIPVVMLTAEGGRDHVLNIVKLGVRGYIVKPFKEAMIIEKVGNLIELKPASQDAGAKRRSITDPIDLMVVEDKPAIITQISQGLKHTNWNIRGVASAAEAIDGCERRAPDVIVVSLSLADNAAVNLMRTLRANVRTKFVPVFALVVKTDLAAKVNAQEGGFNAVVTKPIDPPDLEAKVAIALNLDLSAQYFSIDGDWLVVKLPAESTPQVQVAVTEALRAKLAEAVNSGVSRVAVDLSAVPSLNLEIIKVVMDTTRACRDLGMQVAVVGNAQLIAECKAFEETKNWSFHGSLAEVKAQLGAAPVPAPAPAAVQAIAA